MPTPCAATEADWVLVEALWRDGKSWTALSKAIDGRAAATTIKRRAERQEWARSVHGVEITARPALPALVEAAERSTAARALVWAEERERIMAKLVDRADHLLDRIVKPHTLIETKIVKDEGQHAGSHVETIETPLSEPLPGDQQRLMTSAAIALDKVLLLAGEATSRSETVEGQTPEQRVARAQMIRDELAARREANETAAAVAAEGSTG